jgi:hypothetical protein
MPEQANLSSAEEQLSELFGSYKAEWLKERLFDFFTAPDYLPELTTSRPCVLVGGRGLGLRIVDGGDDEDYPPMFVNVAEGIEHSQQVLPLGIRRGFRGRR